MTAQPVLAPTRGELQALLRPHRGVAAVALVPTMGALHDGHAALIREARREVEGPVVVSIFVNPLQFAPGEDLDRYPRTLDDDLEVCAAAGADIVFAPPVEEVYPAGVPSGPDTAAVTVDPGRLGEVLEGASRPTHFRGVLTVVSKLFGLVRPDVAVFGQKDYQQLVLIRRMAADLCQGVRIVGCATVREDDGLALSSRNRYLDAGQRDAARALSCALDAGRGASEEGAAGVLAAARAALELAGDVDLDYLELTDPNLGPAPSSGEARLLIAARVGSTRLIDNAPVHLSTTLQPTSTSRRGDH